MANTIRAISRSTLDVESYDACVHQSAYRKIYAYSWYLDALCDDWYALVEGDYSAVMPLPVRKKWGIRYVYLPPMVQQLGVFGHEHDDHITFYKMAFGRHVHFDYTFHGPDILPMAEEKLNLILDIQDSPTDLYSNYSSNRKRDLKKATKYNLELTNLSSAELSKLLSGKLNSSDGPTAYQLELLMNQVKSYGDIKVVGVKREGIIIFILLYGIDFDRLYYLFPMELEIMAKDCGAATYAIHELILAYQQQVQYLDFEGSSVPGVRRFYESFNATPEPFFHVKKSIYHFLKHAR
jgi:hypothetical protein